MHKHIHMWAIIWYFYHFKFHSNSNKISNFDLYFMFAQQNSKQYIYLYYLSNGCERHAHWLSAKQISYQIGYCSHAVHEILLVTVKFVNNLELTNALKLQLILCQQYTSIKYNNQLLIDSNQWGNRLLSRF